MNDRQENIFTMVLTVRIVLDDFSSEWQPLQGFVTAVDDLDDAILNVEAARLVQEGKIKGVTTSKGEAEASMIKEAVTMSGAMQAYAIDQKDTELKERITFTKSGLEKLRDTILRDTCVIILKEVQKIGISLQNYGVTAAEVTDYESLVDDYREILAKPRLAIINRKTAGEDLVKHLGECAAIYNDRIDKLMLNFEDDPDHTHFFENYQNARKIVDV